MHHDFLLFTSNHRQLAMPLRSIVEIAQTPTIRSLPHQRLPLMGLARLRNVTMSVFSLEALLGSQVPGVAHAPFTLVLSVSRENQSSFIGLLIDSVISMAHVMGEHIQSSPKGSPPVLESVITHEGGSYFVLNEKQLLNSLHAELIAA